MLFFENYTLLNIGAFLLVLVGLLGINELTRRSKWLSVAFYILIPIIFTLTIWRTGASENTEGNWFAWVKTYSALAGVVGFMALRYFSKLQKNKFMLTFPALILGINILEAVVRDFEVSQLNGVWENGLFLQGGPWNIINGIAGILSVITMSGWLGIKISKNKNQDMVWADQNSWWIIAYGVWNLSYVYNCIPERSFYAGVALVGVSTCAGLFWKKGVWLQHRAQTLALWAMFSLTFPNYANTEYFNIVSTHNVFPLYLLSIAAIIINIGVLVYEIKMIRSTKRNPLREELYADTKEFKEILVSHNL